MKDGNGDCRFAKGLNPRQEYERENIPGLSFHNPGDDALKKRQVPPSLDGLFLGLFKLGLLECSRSF